MSSMGRNDYIKGIWHLLKAFSLVYKEHPEARLVVVGAGNWEPYRDLAKKLGVEGKAVFPVLKKNPFPYVAQSDIYVCSSNHEGFPNAVLEAMALHKPVISADCKTGPREILLSEDEYAGLIADKPDGSSIETAVLGKYGILVPDLGEEVDMDPSSISEYEKELAAQINALLDDDELREKYADAAFERAGVYTPDRYKDSMHEILKRYE
jgi:glycosyltransferase involved in cell wall biosynthesis